MTRVLIAAFDGLLPSQIRADTSECAENAMRGCFDMPGTALNDHPVSRMQ